MQEATLGIDHQLNDVMAIGVRYVHKQIDRAIEDTGFLAAGRQRGLRDRQPGRGPDGARVHQPERRRCRRPIRDYDAVEFAFDKRMSPTGTSARSYLWSRLYGNYSGLTQSDEKNGVGRTSPNVGRLFDYPVMMFQDGGKPAFGPLATDRPHQFKTQFIYQFGFGTSVGVNQYMASGLPVTREDRHLPDQQLPGQVPRPRQRRPHADVLADRHVRAAHVPRAAAARASGQPQRPEPVQPGHGGRQVLDLSQGQRRRHPTRRCSTRASRRSPALIPARTSSRIRAS